MIKKSSLIIATSFGLLVSLGAYAGPKEDFQQVYSEAESTNQNAGTFKWTVTSDRLKAARSAADSGDYGKAKTMATEARNLAQESVAQRKQQAEVWRNVAIGN
ncbi:hypothetical protein MIH18_18010 [Marinobacter sp. M3C]|jgi:hypothetical protein|uniref:hypothetical protein n=1 Tax=unclassified Marinobacter TaxID=83889 RepID=UPI00200C1667|nr:MULTISPECIES: hypothetical protein [unclassified Marinobacter]MCL1479609.1 hypothetical protein [Marinobacter sp.]MCL1482377.1 hypothetical protein [Marinobacter sp.]MCL1485266.1 hypothetical protein [Marinobacter sp.]UQG55057.1 hypothetical protein MIH16_16735 [Marinobacter sp. M4C]UQG59592.1 hypothetical protein MIH18_18010 [Marinobacter sp. M3C]